LLIPLLTEPFLSIIGGGLVATILTLGFNTWWDYKKGKYSEDWEYRRYQANQIHHSMSGLMDAFFSAKSEMLFLTSTLAVLLSTLNRLSAQADQIVRQQGGPELTMAEYEQKKQQLLEPFQKFNAEQVTLRWTQYEQKAKENRAKAEVHLATLESLISSRLYGELNVLFERLSAPFVWDLPNAQEKLKALEGALPEVMSLRNKLSGELEEKLGRKQTSRALTALPK
jgi:hypothetical protein